MKARLLKDARIFHKAGEIVEVSPATFEFLASIGAATEEKKERRVTHDSTRNANSRKNGATH